MVWRFVCDIEETNVWNMNYEIWNVSILISQQTKIEGINLELREMKCMFEIEMYVCMFEIWNVWIPISQQTKKELINMEPREMKCMVELYEKNVSQRQTINLTN